MMAIDTIDRVSDRPLYKQLADRLRARMDAGDIRPGDRLPSESELIADTGMSRATVRRGLQMLVREGRAESKRGDGVYARARIESNRLVLRDPAAANTRFRDLLTNAREDGGPQGPMRPAAESQGFDYRQQILALDEVPAPASVAAALEVTAGTLVFVRRRRVSIRPTDSSDALQPAKLADSYIPLAVANDAIRSEDTGPGGLYARIEDQGIRLTRFDEILEFRMPTPSEARRLALPDGIPVIDQTRVAYAGDRAVECFRAVLAGHLHEFEYRIAV